MLSSFARHGRMYIDLECRGDYQVDDHHSVEDIGICLGKALKRALGDKAGINRFGEATVPMDDALTQAVVDLSGRAFYSYAAARLPDISGATPRSSPLSSARACRQRGDEPPHRPAPRRNRHHIHESIFKALGSRSRAPSCSTRPSGTRSPPKGTIE
jgi:imidazoleglycerol-phosphate dehydratase